MLNRKTHSHLPAICVAVLLAIVAIGLSTTQVAGQNAAPDHIQGLKIVPGQCPGSCGPCCPPNFRYWGHWPTVWRQWPQLRPDITFPQGVGIEPLPAPKGVKPEPLPKEEPFISPSAQQPGGFYVPPISEGPATGPGGMDTPFQLDSGFDQGPGFDQGLPGMENLPAQPSAPETMPIEGTDNTGMPPEVPPATDSAPAMPSPDKNSATAVPNSSVAEALNPLAPHQEQVRQPESQPSQTEPVEEKPLIPTPIATAPIAPEPIAPEPIAPEPIATAPMATAPIAPEPMAARSYMDEPAVGKRIAEIEQPAMEPIRQTTFESPVEPWAAAKSWKSQRTHADAKMPETANGQSADGQIAELEQPEAWRSTNEPVDAQSTAPPEPGGLQKDSNTPTPAGLDGYCPVDLVRNEAWTMGDSRFAVEHEGRVYLMCGPEQHRAFRSNPERYAPANAGNDPVLSFEENSHQAGRTDACAVFEGRLYMFLDADSLARFQANPQRYTRVLQNLQQ